MTTYTMTNEDKIKKKVHSESFKFYIWTENKMLKIIKTFKKAFYLMQQISYCNFKTIFYIYFQENIY